MLSALLSTQRLSIEIFHLLTNKVKACLKAYHFEKLPSKAMLDLTSAVFCFLKTSLKVDRKVYLFNILTTYGEIIATIT